MIRLFGAGIVGLFCCGIWLALFGVMFVGLWKTFEKMGKPGWMGIVPVYNIIVTLEIVRQPLWWLALFIPPVTPVGAVLVGIEVAKCFRKDTAFGVGLGLLGFVFYPILGFGSAQFVGPEGAPVPRSRRRDDEFDDQFDDDDRPRGRRRHRKDGSDEQFTPERPAPKPPQTAGRTADTVMIQCTGCRNNLRVPANVIGKKVKCPACGAVFVAG
jgi:hypothetical protein